MSEHRPSDRLSSLHLSPKPPPHTQSRRPPNSCMPVANGVRSPRRYLSIPCSKRKDPRLVEQTLYIFVLFFGICCCTFHNTGVQVRNNTYGAGQSRGSNFFSGTFIVQLPASEPALLASLRFFAASPTYSCYSVHISRTSDLESLPWVPRRQNIYTYTLLVLLLLILLCPRYLWY